LIYLIVAVKQRLQVYASPYSGAIDCLRKIRKREGLSVLYRSYTTQLTMNIPFHSVHLITYELLQDQLNYARDYDPLSHVISGAVAGAIASAITTPLDVCKTLLNTQECCLASTGGPTCELSRNPTVTATGKSSAVLATEEAKGLVTAVRVIYVRGGLTAFFKGLTPRVLYQMPSTAVAWSCYEFFVSKIEINRWKKKIENFLIFLEAFFCWKTNNIMTCVIFFKQVSDRFTLYLCFVFTSYCVINKIVICCFSRLFICFIDITVYVI